LTEADAEGAIRSMPTSLLLQLPIVLGVAWVLGGLSRRVGQPRVVGEIAGGLLLGPSALGRLSPETFQVLFPDSSLPTLELLSQVALVLFMFGVGVDVEHGRIAHPAGRRAVLAVALAGTGLPFLLGTALAFVLLFRGAVGVADDPRAVLFVGIAMGVTAFPVLARILAERELTRTRIGATALAAAAIGDVAAWGALTLIVASAAGGGGLSSVLLLSVGGSLVFALVLVGVRRLVERIDLRVGEAGQPPGALVALAVALLFASAWFVERVGFHAVIGAFVFALAWPRPSPLGAATSRLATRASHLLLPLFFAFAGLRADLPSIAEDGGWLLALVIVGVAVAGKLGGVAGAARLVGLPWPEGLALGALLNARGLMELVVLSIGLELGLLSPELFSIMFVMALVTTVMTMPALEWLLRRHPELEAR
jgi:Kef-type K+ transport system membrane component KefB